MANADKMIVLTSNPYEELIKFSSKENVEVRKLDFDIIGFSTSYSLNDEEFTKISEKELDIFNDEKLFLDQGLKIEQEYKIKIRTKIATTSRNSQSIELVVSEDKTKISALIHIKELVITEYLAMDILQSIYKKMIEKSFFIGVRVFDFKKKLIKFVKDLQENKIQDDTIEIVVALGIESQNPKNEKLVLSYQENIKKRTDTPIKQISIIGVGENELALKFVKAKEARSGRALDLSFIENNEELENQKITFSCSDDFEVRENEESVEYYSKKKGYISKTNDKFSIENTLDLTSVNFKTNGYIYAGLDNEVTINIRNTSELEEAVNSGVMIECQNLNINGKVAQNTTLRANDIKIIGSTHTKSKIYAKTAYISTHRGYLESEEALIDILENGEIKAQQIKIKKSIGGSLNASKIFVGELNSNNILHFTEQAVIDKCVGGNNKFIIDSAKHTDPMKQERLKEIEERERTIPLALESVENTIKTTKDGIEILIKKIEELKQAQKTIPQNYIQMVRSFENYQKKLKELNSEKEKISDEKREILESISTSQEKIFETKVINKNAIWTDMNEIRFKLEYPKTDILHSTQKDENTKLFCIQRDISANGEIKIKRLNEYDERDIEWSLPSKG